MRDREDYGGFVISGKDKLTSLKIKLTNGAKMPEYKNHGDAGADLYSIEDVVIPSMERKIVKTGLYFEIPYGYEVQIRSRSGLSAKHGVFVLNSPGTIDSGYRGEIMVILQNLGKEDFTVSKGDRIAQMVVSSVAYIPIVEVEEVSDTERGSGGFGSTGVK